MHPGVTWRTVMRAPPELREGLDAAQLRTMRPAMIAGLVIFGIIVPFDFLVLDVHMAIVVVHVASFTVLLAALLLNELKPLGARRGGAVLFGLVLLGLASCAASLVDKPIASSQVAFAITVLASGALFLSWPWLAAAQAATLVSWLASAGKVPVEDRAQFVVTLVTSFVISGLLVYARRHAHIHAASSHARLAGSEASAQRLFASNPLPMWLYDLDTLRFLAVNDAAVAKYGWSREEFLEMTITDIRPAEDVPQLMRDLRSAREPHQRSEQRWRHKLRDGRVIHVEISSHIVDFVGREAALVVTLDVTARVQAEAALRESEQRWRQLVENAPDRIVTLDLDGRLLFVNHLEPGQEAVLGRPVRDLVPPEEGEQVMATLARVRESGKPGHFETTARGIDGKPVWFKSSVGPIVTDGEVSGFIVIATDITREHEIERLKSLDAFKTQFINTAAHEIGTPLTPIRLQLHMLRVTQGPHLTAEGSRSLDILDRNVARLGTLLGDVLDAARLEAGRLSLRIARTDVTRVVTEAVETFEEQARQNDVKLTGDITPDLVIDGDAKRLSQVVFNFLSNALKFTPAGGSVRVLARREGERVLVRVQDTGPGLSAEKAARLFQPFTQVHETSESKHAGTGLGLFISRGIVEQHGGRIWVESAQGRGASFCFELPLAAAGASA